MRPISAIFITFFSLGYMAFAQDDTPAEAVGCMPTRQEDADQMYQDHLKKYAGNAEVLVLPGVVAKRQQKRVEIIAETTPVSKEEAVEFLVVGAASSHGYESFLWSYAKPSDIRRAFDFIGFPAGAAYNPQALQFWPKGERIVASIEDDVGKAVRLEQLIYDRATQRSLPPKGYVYTGSILVPDPKDAAKTIMVADKFEPYAVISGFNASAALIEPNWTISQGDAYQRYQIHPESDYGENEILTLLLEPESVDGKRRVCELKLTIQDPQTFLITGDEGKQLNHDTSVQGMLDKCLEIKSSGRDPYLTLDFHDELTLRDIHRIAKPLAILDRPEALRIDPPAEGRLYYRSFIPPESWRHPEERVSQSWEVHIDRIADGLTARMVIHDEIWKDVSIKPELLKRSFDAPTAEAMMKCIADDAAAKEGGTARLRPRVLFVYAPGDLKYRELLNFLQPVIKTHKIVHIYLEEPETPAQP